MRRLILIIGLVAFPLAVQAQTPLSPWVQEVINRADAGIGTAQGLSASTPCEPAAVIADVQDNLTAVREAQTAVVTLEAESESLRGRTVCYEYDRRLLQDKMNQVLTSMDDAVRNCKLATGKSLRDVYQFLADAYASFLFGGANPSYKDDRLRYHYPFEDTSLTQPLYDSGSTLPVCAFTSDYSPHAIAYIPTPVGGGAVAGGAAFDVKSFGCDADVLGNIPAPFNDEASTLKDFITKTDVFARDLYNTVSIALLNMSQFFAQISGKPTTQLPGAQPPAPHVKVSGCLKPLVPDPASSTPQEWEELLLAYPEYFDPDKGNKDPSGNITFGPTAADQVLPTGLLFVPVVDYFRTMPAAFSLTRQFIDRRTDAGASRPMPKAFVNQSLDSYVSVMSRKIDSNNSLQYIGSNIEQEMAYLEESTRDATQNMREAAKPLESAVNSLVYVVTEFLPGNGGQTNPQTKEGGYIPQLTYFLARSCVDGHCQQTLDSVAKRIYNPYCHPYVSGDYMNDDTQKRCFCDPSIQGSWGDYDKYCNKDFSSDQGKYSAMPPKLFPGCTEDSLFSSSSSTAP